MDNPDPTAGTNFTKGLLKFFFICAAIFGSLAFYYYLVAPAITRFSVKSVIQEAQTDLVAISEHMENKDYSKALQKLDKPSLSEVYPWEEALIRAAISLEQKDYDQVKLNLELMKMRKQIIHFPNSGLSTHRLPDPGIMMKLKNVKPGQKHKINPFREERMLCYPLLQFKNTSEGQKFLLKKVICNSAEALGPLG